MWGLNIPDLAAWFGTTGPPATTTLSRSDADYLCETCCVYGTGEKDSLRCWCCGSDDLKRNVRPIITSTHDSGGLRPASYEGELEEVASLVG